MNLVSGFACISVEVEAWQPKQNAFSFGVAFILYNPTVSRKFITKQSNIQRKGMYFLIRKPNAKNFLLNLKNYH